MQILYKICSISSYSGHAILSIRHLDLNGAITLPNDSAVRIILHLFIYFSMVLLKAAWAL